MTTATWIILGVSFVAVVLLVLLLKWILSLRRVVSTNEAHVVRKGSTTMEYGGSKGGSYYQWPEWVPAIGVSVTKLSLENFVLPVDDYEAYDKEKLPFVVDIRAFFHIKDCMMAATRASSMDLLRKQLADVVKDAVRTILAQDDLEKIMVECSKYGDEFTKEVNQQLASWGVETIKTIELMDIRDSRGEEVISNIMAKKKSAIEKDSRVTVAKNQQEAKEAEIARDAKVVEAEADRRKTEIDAEAALVRATKNAEGIEAEGLNSALDVLTPKGGSNIAGALEAFAATDAGKALLEKLGVKLG